MDRIRVDKRAEKVAVSGKSPFGIDTGLAAEGKKAVKNLILPWLQGKVFSRDIHVKE